MVSLRLWGLGQRWYFVSMVLGSVGYRTCCLLYITLASSLSSKHDFAHCRSSKQHAYCTSLLATDDFLLVFYGDFRSADGTIVVLQSAKFHTPNCSTIGADFHRAMAATVPAEKFLIGRRQQQFLLCFTVIATDNQWYRWQRWKADISQLNLPHGTNN